MKKCNFCLIEKEYSDFPKKGARCKSCTSLKNKKYWADNKEKLSEYSKEYYTTHKQEILEKTKKYYDENKDTIKEYKDVYNKENYDSDYHREYREKNKVEISEKRKTYYKENKETIKERVRNYNQLNNEYVNKRKKSKRDKNKDYYNEMNKNYIRNKKEKDPLYRLSCDIRSLISQSFKSQFTKKSRKTIEILGCTFDEFKLHIENQFSTEMSWENYSVYWQLDHKIPISWAKSEEEVYKLNHFTNFQPLYWRENIIKGNRRSD